MQLITIWSNGKGKLASGYRRVFVISVGSKYIHLFDPHYNTHLRMRKKEYEYSFCNEEKIHEKHWAKLTQNKLHINKYYRQIFEFTAGEEEMSLAVMNETLVVLKEIRDLLKGQERALEPDKKLDTSQTKTVSKQHMDFWDKQKQKPPVTIFEETPQNEVEKLKPKRRGRPKGSKGKKK